MKSVTKHLLTEEQIRKLVKVNFGECYDVGMVRELKGGLFNSAYLIGLPERKEEIVLKVSVAEGTPILSYEKATMYTEIEVYKLIAQQTTIPIPKLLAYDFSRKEIPADYFFMTALKGETMFKSKPDKESKERIEEELADYFVQLHKIKGEYFGYFAREGEVRFATWKDAFLHMMEMILGDGRKNNIKLPYGRYEKLLKEKAKYLEQVKEPLLVDYDLHPGNIFLKKQEEGYVVEGIVDFERAFWGDPLADFPAAFLRIDDIRQKPAFWEAYRKKAGNRHDITKEEEIRQLIYRLYLFTIMAVEIYRYGFLYAKLQSGISKKVIRKCMSRLEQL